MVVLVKPERTIQTQDIKLGSMKYIKIPVCICLFMIYERWPQLSKHNDTMHTAVDMAEPPLKAMEILRYELL